VPTSFEAFEGTIRDTFARLVDEGALAPRPDVDAPAVPQDLEAAKKAGKARARPTLPYPTHGARRGQLRLPALLARRGGGGRALDLGQAC
jgi:ATP citrate (pro-S)-lyase